VSSAKIGLTILLTCFVELAISQNKDGVKIQPDRIGQEEGKQNVGSYVLSWTGMHELESFDERKIWTTTFEGATIDPVTNLPFYKKTVRINEDIIEVRATIIGPSTKLVAGKERTVVERGVFSKDFEVTSSIRRAGKRKYLVLEITPFRKMNGGLEKLLSFDVDLQYIRDPGRDGERDNSWKAESVLSTGQWYEVRTGEDRVYKLTYAFLRDVGFNMDQVNSSSIHVYGTPGGELATQNELKRPDDLEELSIEIQDGGDGVFDPGDQVLFYGEDQVTWGLLNEKFIHKTNNYDDSSSYFITISGTSENPNRLILNQISGASNKSSSTYDYVDFHESESSNLIKSGQDWYGEQLGLVSNYDFGFSVPDVVKSEQASVHSRFAMRSVSISGNGLTMSLPNQGGRSDRVTIGSVSSAYATQYAKPKTATIEFNPVSSDFLTKLTINKPKNPNAQAWIDYVEINARRSLVFIEPTMNFRDLESVGENNTTSFSFKSSNSAIRVWDVTNVSGITEMVLSGNTNLGFKFTSETDSLKEFVMFTNNSLATPSRVGPVENQNLHALSNIDYLIITHPNFKSYSDQLAELHQKNDGFTTAVVEVGDIYNEFSGGSQDITAIKEFVRMLYFEGQGGAHPLKYLLLFGDASYDFKNRVSGNSNFVPSHQTKESLVPTASVVSDDFYGLLDDDEGEESIDLIDIAIGRLPARTKLEAEQMVNKIIHYTDSKGTFGDWRNSIALVADDPEGGRDEFQDQCSILGELADSLSPEFNVHKIYLDAYTQVAGSGGERYPEAAAAISERVRKGALMIYYIGHGGELGWAHERVLEVPTINKWENLNNLPLFVTATCEFTRYDDPRRTSAGEYVMFNPSGGGVALLTTTRAVYSGPNFDLTHSFTRQAFEALQGEEPRLGDMCAQTKVENASTGAAGNNTRCFTLLGDPAMRLAFPQERVIVTEYPDTIKGLEKVVIKGYVADRDSTIIKDFNGLVYPTLYDKISRIQGQNNDGEGVFFYNERRNILFRGKSSVKNGEFEFEFVVPKDINRAFGEGKLSFYAHNGEYDANGADFGCTIGGLSDNPILDDDGPQVDLYMNDDKFVFGGMTNENPDLYAKIWDENGVNMVGTGIGHDITAVLDEKGANTIVLNDYYESEVDSYQSGKIRYPFDALEEGIHTLKLQVWDVNNNPGEAYTEFVVANDEQFALDHILNYPNPFTTNTDFYFEHNKPGFSLDVRIEVFTVSGKLVKTIDGEYLNDGFRVGPINWNGRDDFGDNLARGVYLYKLKVKTPLGEHAEQYEKLVILK
jgi:hypothetical protein